MRFGAQTEVVMSLIMAQGLMDGGLATQGWSRPSLLPSMVTQGLLGPHVLLQGLAGAHNVYAITPSGGSANGGTAAPKTLHARSATGGLRVGGSARWRSMLTTAAHGGISLGGQKESSGINYRVYANQG